MELNTHYKYDTLGRYYYLTPVGAELITGIQDIDLVWANAISRLKNQGSQLHEIMCMNSVEGYDAPRFRRRDIVEHMIYKNLNNELNDTLYMLGEYAQWGYDVDGDRITYEERNPYDIIRLLPFTITNRGRSSKLIYMGVMDYEVPSDEYQVGY